MKFLVFSLLFSVLAITSLRAQAPQEQQYVVLGITVEGNTNGNAETIIAQSQLQKGSKFTLPSEDFRHAIDRLWQQNIYSDVHIDASKLSPQADGTIGVFLVIKVKEFPRVDSVVIQGNQHFNRTDIEKNYTFYKNQFLRPWDIQTAKQKIKAAYIKDGYNFVQINTEIIDRGEGKSWLVFKINEGTEVTVRHIDFTGNEKLSSANLRSSMDDTHEKRWWKIFTSGSYDERKYEEDKQKMLAFYRSKGFRDASIISDSVWVTEGSDLSILIHLYEGPKYYIRHISIVGNEVFSEPEVRSALGFRDGDLYNVEKFELNMK
ncbi:MAG TPA: POTRA domain-containing protein, partial [Candidatus Kapabacteria bacterium]|nr:POTRA domain-containing protein [Candidatus Kapabacteria bacterium]